MLEDLFNFNRPPVWTVADLTRYLRDLLESDANLADIWVQGEVSNVSRPRSGHLYFTLKDARAQLRVVMWKPRVMRLRFLPQNGQQVEVHGAISVYEAGGQYQLYADTIRPLGEGEFYREFLRLKARLEAEGLFDEGRKRPVPPFPRRIGIVTSPTGAALRDMLNTIRRRYPLAEVVLAPALVQGEQAPEAIIRALEALNTYVRPDVILLARGGGLAEDLWAFNDERVVRAVVASAAPVITGVGHQTDFTLVDFAADLRAPTPTAAAEKATPNRDDLRHDLRRLGQRLARALESRLRAERLRLRAVALRLERRAPLAQVQSDRQRLDDREQRLRWALRRRLRQRHLELRGWAQRLRDAAPQQRLRAHRVGLAALDERLRRAWRQTLRWRRVALEHQARRLAALSPLAVLQRGYAIVRDEQGRVVRRAGQVAPGDALEVLLAQGRLWSRVEYTEPDEREGAP